MRISDTGLTMKNLGQAMRFVLCALVFGVALASVPPAQAQNVLRIAAVVNDRVISALDVIERMKFVMFSTNMPNTPDNQRRLVKQILGNLVNEELRLQEANRLNINVRDRDIKKAIQRLEKNNKIPSGELSELLLARGISLATLRRKLESDIAWSRTVSRRLRRENRIGNDAVDDEIARIKTLLNQPQYRVAEIFLSIDDPDREDQVRASALRLLEQSRNGANFAALARNFSQSTSASLGGDLGWIQTGQLNQELDDAITNMAPGDIAGPIRTTAGFYLLHLRDRRQADLQGPDDVIVELHQIALPVKAGATPAEIAAQKIRAQEIRASIASCADLPALAKSIGTKESGALGKIKLRDLPVAMRDAVRDLKIGTPSAPVLSPAGKLLILTVCARANPEINLPSRRDVRNQLRAKQFNLLARRYLRDLRRSAYVDLRG
jgi:peptidyl-prolyl cis-trans isomerase SurA